MTPTWEKRGNWHGALISLKTKDNQELSGNTVALFSHRIPTAEESLCPGWELLIFFYFEACQCSTILIIILSSYWYGKLSESSLLFLFDGYKKLQFAVVDRDSNRTMKYGG